MSFTDWMKNPANQSTINNGINAVGGALSAAGAASTANANREVQQQQLAQNATSQLGQAQQIQQGAYRDSADAASSQYTNWLNDQRTRAAGVLQARPLGTEQGYEQRNATMSALIPGIASGLANAPRPGNSGIASRMADMSFNIDPQALARLQSSYSADNTARAIGQFNNDLSSLSLGQSAPNMQMAGLYGKSASPYLNAMADWGSQQAKTVGSREAEMQAKVQAALDQNISGATDYVKLALQREQEAQKAATAKKDDGGGFWKKLLGIGAMAAIPFTGGLSAAIAPALGISTGVASGLVGAGLGAAGGALSGNGAVSGATQGGISGFLGSRVNGNQQTPTTNTALPEPELMQTQRRDGGLGTYSFIDPRTYGQRRTSGVNF